MIRTYLEWIVSLPWSNRPRTTSISLTLAGSSNRDHYDIDKVKERIIESLAVRKLNPDTQGSILCFVGPPGVGEDIAGQVDRRRPRA